MRKFLACAPLLLAGAVNAALFDPVAAKIDPGVLSGRASSEPVEALLMLAVDNAASTPSASDEPASERGRRVVERLRSDAARRQASVIALLEQLGVEHREFWIVNAIWVRATPAQLEKMAARPEVVAIAPNPHVRNRFPAALPGPAPDQVLAVQPSLTAVRAPELWALGFSGQGAVVGGEDTGYQWDHPALKAKYRGWNGTTANHAYQWHDAIHNAAAGNPCGSDAVAPCDDDGHGTHTMGTMVGDDGAGMQIGMAPQARWMGCRNMDAGDGTPARYIECIQWFTAPTDLSNQNPDPAMRPDAINNSWGCPTSEGCNSTNFALLDQAIVNARATGIVFVASAGNSGSACSTVLDPPAIFASSFVVAATNNSGTIVSFSSRGPVTVDGSNRLKPDIGAPGSSITSSYAGGGYTSLSGTSMAGPHVAGAVALLVSAFPAMRHQPDFYEGLLRNQAVPKTSTQNCGAFSGAVVPNAVYGSGFMDVKAAYDSGVSASGGIFQDGFE